MIIGFTGTQEGCNEVQLKELTNFLTENKDQISAAHHGCCIGADSEFHFICVDLEIPIIGHPPIKKSKVDANVFGTLNMVNEPLEYLERNRKIVEVCDLLLAAPAQNTEILRSGTWSTIRYAKKVNIPVVIFFPLP